MLHKLFLRSQITSTLITHNTIKVLLPSAGYLCVHVEKDESLGTTLILTWVPNSRIQRQDEEALRYITPESSPVRRNARRRGRRYKNVLLKMCLWFCLCGADISISTTQQWEAVFSKA